MIADDTNILPAHLAAVIANGVPALQGRPLQPLIAWLCRRAEARYVIEREFREGVQREGSRGRSYLRAFMRGWAMEWAAAHYPQTKREVNQ